MNKEILSNSPNRKGRRHALAERNGRKKSSSYNLFDMRGWFADVTCGFNDLRMSARGVVLNIRPD
jgi:hypothetical protein